MEKYNHSNKTRAWVGGLLALVLTVPANALTISDSPLFLTSGGKANVLVVLDNSNSMDEAASGAAVGSSSADSKSEIARSVVKGLVTSHTGKINMGLMAYQQNDPLSYHLHNSPYDVSYNPANYNPSYAGLRDSLTKKYRTVNPSDAGNYIYYNVALPFYSASNEGNAFCYSATADFDNGSETYPSGFVADNYRCLASKTGASDTLPTPFGDTSAETAAGYGGTLVYSGGFYPTDSDIAQNILDFGRFNTWSYIGTTWFSNISPGRGYLHTPIKLLDATQASALNAKLACNIPGSPSPCTDAGIRNAGLTPIEGTLLTAKDYFAGTLSKTSEGYTASCYPLPTSCGHNYVVLVTDGLPSTAADGTVITDPSAAITAAAAAAAALKAAGVETYVVGFALPYGVDPSTLNTIAASGGTGTAYSASDPATLTAALTAIFADIESKTSSAAAVATNSTRLNTDTLVYQARFNSGDWSGQIVAYPLESDGDLGAAKWDTDTSGKIPAAASRNIFTWNGTAKVTFKSTDFASLNATQKAALNAPDCSTSLTGDTCGQARIDWLRGDATQEVKNGGPFRNRDKPLGDVVNSDPLFVGADNYGYVKLGDSDGGGPKYIDFLTWKQTREGMLYVGANDGMMHALLANTGVEKFAYVPRSVYSNLSLLTQPGYTHKYFVDGPSTSADARIGSTSETAPKWGWRTVLVGTLGAGGKGVFALDITDPSASDFGKPLWEVTSADTGFADLGYVMGAPQIVKLNSGEWVAIFGNGYNSTATTAKLFIVNLATGALIKKIDAGSATANGLGAPAVYDGDENRLIGDYSGSTPTDAIYAGDLLGNVWKFGNSSSGWIVSNKSGPTFVPLFSAKDSAGKAQPITAPLEIGERPTGTSSGVMIYVGTGSYFTTDDRTNKDVQSLYGIWDNGTTTSRSGLQQQTITHEFTEFGERLRVVSNNTVTYTGSSAKRGWYMDLIQPPLGTAQGERVVSTPLLRHGRVIFTTLIPSTEACSFGGTSWLMELTATTGGRLDYSVFDLDKNNLFNEKDYVTVKIAGVDTKVPVSGLQSKVGITKAPAVVSAGSIEYKVASGTDTSGTGKGVQVTKEKGTGGKPRTSWKQLFPEDK